MSFTVIAPSPSPLSPSPLPPNSSKFFLSSVKGKVSVVEWSDFIFIFLSLLNFLFVYLYLLFSAVFSPLHSHLFGITMSWLTSSIPASLCLDIQTLAGGSLTYLILVQLYIF